ncbi:hypothetical protein [Agrobacterium burrii]|uniref:Uncharacterized protein n=1 Tax=Agrobacterium burrii TaxID=2815339 RepID=A0ABS3EQ67_9HYPH|nr:hypothetical protein [Agrobacterium burrii]MBO0134145.1 hypothetical protein [Agrobacterium burrii]
MGPLHDRGQEPRVHERRDLVKAYFPTEKEGKAAGDVASKRYGLISVLLVPLDPRIPVAQLRWIVGNMHVGTSDEELTADISPVRKAGR